MLINMPSDSIPCQPFRCDQSVSDFAALAKTKSPVASRGFPSAAVHPTSYLPDIPPIPMPMPIPLIGAKIPPGPNL
jgi:hypothetical protein